MTKLSAEAYAIIEGRHSDPFHYLGLHSEGGKSVVRAFLPEAVQCRGDRRAWRDRAADAHPRFRTVRRRAAERLAALSAARAVRRQRRRARGPLSLSAVLSDFDLYLLGEGTHQRIYDKLGAHPMTLEGVDGVAFVVLAPNARRVSVVGDFNFWNARRHPMRVRGDGYWELFIPHAQRRRPLQVRHHRPARPASAAEIRSGRLCRGGAAEDRLDRARRDEDCRIRARRPRTSTRSSAPMSIYEVHLGSWRRKGNNEWLTYRELAEQLAGLCPRPRLYPYRIPADQRASVRRLLGLSADRHVRADQPVRLAGRFRACWSTPATAKGSASCSTGCPGISPTIRTASAISTAPRSTSTPIRCRAAISTGAR